jgi:peptidyl-prolyl cis-trans isomerase B (cyclophilin B)
MRRSLTVAPAIVAALLLAGCGGGSSGGQKVTPATAPLSTSPGSTTLHCATVPTPHASPQQFAHEPKLTIARTTYTATIATNCGTIVVALDGKHAPHTVNSFVFLAAKGFFNDSPCHRLTTSGIYVLQCGDPTGTGYGGPGYTLPDENLKGAKYPVGTVAMANSGPNSGGSQFFLVYGPSEKVLDAYASYTPFGTITSGLDLLRRIAAAGSNPPGDGKPVQPVVIESFSVKKG